MAITAPTPMVMPSSARMVRKRLLATAVSADRIRAPRPMPRLQLRLSATTGGNRAALAAG